jgi:hypothetical protein
MPVTPETKIIIAIVEGSNDEVGLQKLLEFIVREKYRDTSIKVQVMGYDLTQIPLEQNQSIADLVSAKVTDYMEANKLSFLEVPEIIEICDIDGAFLKDEALVPNHSRIFYGENCVYCPRVEEIIARNKTKRDNLQVLVKTKELGIGAKKIPYSIYFFSCNFEDVFSSKRNNDSPAKRHVALELDEKFTKDPKANLAIFRDQKLFPFSDFDTSWASVGGEHERILRLSNFNLWFLDVIRQS